MYIWVGLFVYVRVISHDSLVPLSGDSAEALYVSSSWRRHRLLWVLLHNRLWLLARWQQTKQDQPLMKGWTQVTSQSRTYNLDSRTYSSISSTFPPSLLPPLKREKWKGKKGKKNEKVARALVISFADSLKTPFSPSLAETKARCCETSSNKCNAQWSRTRHPSCFHAVSKKKHCCDGKLWKAYMKSNWPCSGFYWTHKREYKLAITLVGREVVFSPSKPQKMTLVHSVAPPCSSLWAKKKYCCITVSLKEIKKITSKTDQEKRKHNVWHLIQWTAFFFLSHLVSPFNGNPC